MSIGPKASIDTAIENNIKEQVRGNTASTYYYDVPEGTKTIVAYKDKDLKVRDDGQTSLVESWPKMQKIKAVQTINAVKAESSSFFSGKALDDGYHSSVEYTKLLNSEQ